MTLRSISPTTLPRVPFEKVRTSRYAVHAADVYSAAKATEGMSLVVQECLVE